MLRIGIVGNKVCVDETLIALKAIEGCGFVGCYTGYSNEDIVINFDSLEELFEHIDAVIILKPDKDTHYLTEQVVRHQIPCLIESPFAPSYAQGKSFMNLVHEAQVYVQVSNPYRYNLAFSAAQSYIHQPVIIECFRHSTQINHQNTASVILNLMIFDIDNILSIVKCPVKKIAAIGLPIYNGSPDVVNARIEFENGCVANITAGKIAQKDQHEMSIFQKSGHLIVDFLSEKTVYFKINTNDSPTKANYQVIKPQSNIQVGSELSYFIQTVKNNQSYTNFAHSLSALEIAYFIHEKIQQNNPHYAEKSS